MHPALHACIQPMTVCNIHVTSYITAIKGYCNMAQYRMLLTCYWCRRWWRTWNYSETQSLQMFTCLFECKNMENIKQGSNTWQNHCGILKYAQQSLTIHLQLCFLWNSKTFIYILLAECLQCCRREIWEMLTFSFQSFLPHSLS